MNRADAIKACKELKPSAILASIPDMTINAFVQSLVTWRSWIGLEKVSGEWVWPDGTKATLTNWLPNQPSGDGPFVEMFADPGQWNDLSSSHKRGAVCQYDTLDGKFVNLSKKHVEKKMMKKLPSAILIISFLAVVLITGGSDRKSAEIYNPATKASCSLPQFAEVRAGHTQDGELACGGGISTCVKWSPDSGTWDQSHTLREARVSHLSWVTESGVYLMGGYNTRLTSEKVNMDGSVEESFNLKHETRYKPHSI